MWLIIPILLTLHVIICLLLVAAVLMQLPRSEGLGAAFGGGMTENLFGAQTTHVLTRFTVWLGIGFFVVTLLLAMAYAHQKPKSSKLERELLGSDVPAAETSATADKSGQPTDQAAPTQESPGDQATAEPAPADASQALAPEDTAAAAFSPTPTATPSSP